MGGSPPRADRLAGGPPGPVVVRRCGARPALAPAGRRGWAVLVSEVMLQQTPVARVLPAYDAWLARWPSPAALAAEPAGAAVRLWGRLGYPRRALALHAAATAITLDHGGQVPADLDALLALPGVGAYTARAVAAFAFRQRHPVVDTNVRRVIARHRDGIAAPHGSTATRHERARVAALMPAERRRGGDVRRGFDGARRPRVHGTPAAVRGLPRRGRLRVARRRITSRHRAAPAGVRRHGPAGTRSAARSCPRRDRPGRGSSTRCCLGRAQATRTRPRYSHVRWTGGRAPGRALRAATLDD